MKETKTHKYIQWAHMGVCNGQTDFGCSNYYGLRKKFMVATLSYFLLASGGGREQTNYIFHMDYNVRV